MFVEEYKLELETGVDPWHDPRHGFTLEPQVAWIVNLHSKKIFSFWNYVATE